LQLTEEFDSRRPSTQQSVFLEERVF